jgi:hypothetical protein
MVTNTIELRDLRRLYDIRDLLHLGSNKKLIVCPLPQHTHHHRTPSFSIYYTKNGYQKFRCHGNCGKEGDILDLVGFMKVPGYDPRDTNSIKAAISLLTGSMEIHPPKPEVTKKHTLPNGLYKDFLPAGNEVRQYAAKRSLTPETLDRFHIGQASRNGTKWMTMPAIHGDRLRGIKLRNLYSREKRDRFSSIAGSLDGLFNFNGVYNTDKPVLIVKGEIAVMILSQFNILACAPTGGEGSYNNHEEYLQPLAFSPRRIVIGDNDQDPAIREKMVAAAHKRKQIFRADALYLPPDPFVGIDDFVIARPEVAVPMIKAWMEK